MPAKFSYGAKNGLLYSANIDCKFIRDFAKSPLLQVLQHKTHPLGVAKVYKCRCQLIVEFPTALRLLRCFCRIQHLGFERLEHPGPVFPEELQSRIDGNTVNPCLQPGRMIELVTLVPCAQERFLNGVLCEFRAARNPQAC